MPGFTHAVKHEAKLRLALTGPSGAGKTMTALILATALADGKPVAVVDTERGSASKYADQFAFDVLELDDFHPTKYVQAIKDAVAGGYAVIVIDSLSHAWYGTNGMLELVAKQGKTFDAWGRVKPIENQLLEALTGSPIHVIATMRSKVQYEVTKDEKTGKMTPQKVGTTAIQREGIEYEFDIAGELDQLNTLTISKSRCPALAGAVIAKPDAAVAKVLREWLAGATPTAAHARPTTNPVAAKPAAPIAEQDDGSDIVFEVVDSRPAEPAFPPPALATGGATIKDLRLRALKTRRITTVAQWEDFCGQHAGTRSPDPRRMDASDKERLIAAVEALERGEGDFPEERADTGTDLSKLATPHVRP